MVQLPLPYVDVVATPASPNADLFATVQIRLGDSVEAVGIVEADLVEAVVDYLEGITGAPYAISTIVSTKHVQTDTVL